MKYKSFRFGDIFDVRQTNKLSVPGKSYIMDKDIISKDGKTPYIAAISTNNGIAGYSIFPANNKGDCITLSTTADSSNTVFYQDDDFIGRQQIAAIRRIDNLPMGRHVGLYVASIVRKITKQFNYSNKLTKLFLLDSEIVLPAKTKLVPDFELLTNFAGGGYSMSNIDTSSWKEFKISEIFGESKLGKYHNPESLVEDKNGYPYICASNQNNGINKNMPRVKGENLTLTKGHIISWGKQCPMFSYHDEPCVTAQGMYYIELPETIDEKVAIFLCSVLTKACEGKYSYGNCLIGSKMDETVIKLPAKETEVPDWEYMQKHIAELEAERVVELEAERVVELEAYLVTTGLNDCGLSEEDEKNLSGKYIAENFKLNDLFEKIKTSNIEGKANDFPTEPIGPYTIPLLTAGINNQGLARYAQRFQCPTILSNVISISANGANTGVTYYQDKEFSVLQDAYAIKLKECDIPNKRVGLYLTSCINKVLHGNFNWSYKAGWERIKTLSISLPIQTDTNNNPIIDPEHKYHPDGYVPDWDYMAKYIKAIEKVVIADVVKYKDAMIAKTKEIVA